MFLHTCLYLNNFGRTNRAICGYKYNSSSGKILELESDLNWSTKIQAIWPV